LAGRELAAQGEEVELAVRVASAELADPEVPVVRAALAVPEDLVVPAVRAALAVPENPVVLVVLAVPGDPVVLAALVVPVAPAELVDRVAQAELERDRVEVELVLVPEEAVPVHGHPRGQLEARRKTRLVIAPLHRAQVLALRVEDSAGAAETMRDPAATEAEKAWAAAG
jgi:hypothetical protein